MAKVNFHYPVADISGRCSAEDKVIYRTRAGRTHSYVVNHPYNGPVAPNRQRTIDTFREAVNGAKAIFADPELLQQWQARYDEHVLYHQTHPNSSEKYYQTLRGFIIANFGK